MAMEFEHSFTIPVPPEQAWGVLLDVERIAPCMPGAAVDTVEGDDITGRVRVKVGPITMTYTGHARFVDRDSAAHTVTIEASGRESRGSGTAAATVHAALHGDNGQTRVTMSTTLNVTGRPAQMGRGVLAEVSAKLIQQFAANLATQLASDRTGGAAASPGPAAGSGPAAGAAPGPGEPGAGVPASGEAAAVAAPSSASTAGPAGASAPARAGAGPQAVAVASPQAPGGAAATGTERDDALNLLGVAAGPVLKRLAPALGAVVAALLVALVVRRRRKRRRAS